MNQATQPDPIDPAASLLAAAERAMQGEEDGFEEIHRRLRPGVKRFFAVKGQFHLAEELAQETWVEIWRALSRRRYDPERAGVTTFVHAIAWKVLLRRRRASHRDPALPGQDEITHFVDSLLPDLDDPGAGLELGAALEALNECLESEDGSLTDDERLVMRGLYFEGGSERELASRMGKAASSVHARKISALKKLGRCLQQKGHAED